MDLGYRLFLDYLKRTGRGNFRRNILPGQKFVAYFYLTKFHFNGNWFIFLCVNLEGSLWHYHLKLETEGILFMTLRRCNEMDSHFFLSLFCKSIETAISNL